MRKFFALISAFVIMTIAAQVQAAELSAADATVALDTITQKLREWHCMPLRIWYSGIALDDEQNVAYMNSLAKAHGFDEKFTACMVFYSDFHSPPDDGEISAWEHDTDYKDWSWYFGLYEDGEWKLLTFGY